MKSKGITPQPATPPSDASITVPKQKTPLNAIVANVMLPGMQFIHVLDVGGEHLLVNAYFTA